MSNLKKTIIFGLAGWATLAFFSVVMYLPITHGTCYFGNSWLFCQSPLSGPFAMLCTVLLTLIVICLALSGVYAWRAYHEVVNVAKNKIIFLIALFISLAFCVVPFASTDIVFYFYSGKATHEGINPFTQDWKIENHFFKPALIQPKMRFGYGPLMARVYEGFYLLSGENLLTFIVLWKLSVTLLFGACGWLVYRYLSINQAPPDSRQFLIVWFLQPLALFEWVAMGHFDVLWLCLLLIALILAQRKKWFWILPCLTVGVWLKFVPIFFVPWFALKWWQEVNWNNWKKMFLVQAGALGLSALITLISWRGLWGGSSVFASIALLSKWAAQSLFAAVYFSLVPLFTHIFHANFHWYLTRFAQGSLLILMVYLLCPIIKKCVLVVLKKTVFSEAEFVRAIFVTLLVYMLVWQKSLWPWYLLWFLPLGTILYIQNKNELQGRIFRWVIAAPLFYYVVIAADWFFLSGMAAGTSLWFDYYMVLSIIVYPLFILWRWRQVSYDVVTKN